MRTGASGHELEGDRSLTEILRFPWFFEPSAVHSAKRRTAQSRFNNGRVLQETDPCEALVLPPDLAWKDTKGLHDEGDARIARQPLIDPDLGAAVGQVDHFALHDTAIPVQCCIPRHQPSFMCPMGSCHRTGHSALHQR
jgi:hypothetical protein